MEEKLARLIHTYAKDNKNIDDVFLKIALSILMDYYDVEDYVKYTKSSIISLSIGSYNPQSKRIVLNKFRLHTHLTEFKNSFSPALQIESTYKYIIAIKILIHELEHARQYKALETIYSLESLILESDLTKSTELFNSINKDTRDLKGKIKELLDLKKKMISLYEYSPSERLAEISASFISSRIAHVLDDQITSTMLVQNYFSTLLRGYNIGMFRDKSDEPTKFYLDSIDSNKHWDEIVLLSESITENDKIKYGLKADPTLLIKIYMTSEELKQKLISKK